MARLTFPSDRLVYTASTYAGSAFTSAANAVATVFSDSAGTTLADVQNFDGSPNAAATFTVDTTSRLPLFLGPAAGTDSLYVKVGAGPVTAIYAVTSGDISAAVGIEVTNRTAADAAHVATSNPHSVTPQMIGAPTVVIHGATAGTARPAGATFVHWVGSVAPTNVTGNDEWTDTANKILKRWNGASFDSLGSAASGSSLTPTAVKTTGYTASASDFVPVDTTSGNVTVTLPTAPADKTQIGVKHVVRGGTNAVTIAAGGTDKFNVAGGSATASLTLLREAAIFQYAASSGLWYALSNDLPLSQLGALATKSAAAVPGDLTASGTPSSTTFLRGDGSWATPAGGTSTPLRPGLKTALYYAAGSSDGTNLNLGNGVASVSPFWFPAGTTLTRLGIFLTGAASAGGVFRFIVYADDGAGYPAALISDAGTVPTTTGATGVGLTGLSISVSGWVWVGGVQQGAPATLATIYFTQENHPNATIGRDLANLWNNATCYTQTAMTGAAPGTFGTPSVGTQAYRIGVGL